MQRTAKRAARVVATDDVLVDAVREVLGVPRERILVIPNAVDVADCVALVNGDDRRHVLERVEAADAKPLLVTVGRLAPNKGFDVALRALARIGEQLPGTWKWIIVGDGPLGDQLGARIRALGVSDHVRLAGALSDAETHNLLAAADVFLNPTLYEGSSLVTLEAMAHGRAIVATRAGGIPDKITEGETGWLVAPGDPAAFGEAILRCWTAGPAERAKRGDAARARCLERFDWSVATRRYVEAIRELSRSGTGLTA
jgi:glycosyltransferase involved in cell wall biosynthesis